MFQDKKMPPALRARLATLSKAGFRGLQENRLEDARRWFEQLQRLDPGNCYAAVGLGELTRKQGDLPAARRHYGACLEREPENPFALKGAAECAWETQDYGQAAQLWERCLRPETPDPGLLAHAADAWRKQGELTARGTPTGAPCGSIRSTVTPSRARQPAVRRGPVRGGGRLLGAAARPRSRNIRVLTGLGNCHRKLRDFSGALSLFEAAAELEPGNFYALYGIADCLRGLRNPEGSLAPGRRSWRAPDNRIILTRAGDACRNLGRLERAESYYRRALAAGPDVFAQIGLARLESRRAAPGKRRSAWSGCWRRSR